MYWWDYPAETQVELETCYQNSFNDQDNYVPFQYSYGVIAWHPQGSVADEDDDSPSGKRRKTLKMSTYHLFPGRRQQVNQLNNNVRPMRRAMVEVARDRQSQL